jgi:pyruvate carboxylase
MRILKTLQEAEKEFGDEMVRVELERKRCRDCECLVQLLAAEVGSLVHLS